MKIAINHSVGSFSEKWISYCKAINCQFKLVNCYKNNILLQLEDCDALIWHFSQNNPKDIIFAKQLLFAVETSGLNVFPDFKTCWHFDDKVGQKYLLEAIEAPLVPTWIFYDKQEAHEWARNTVFPKVLKLRGGAGSQNVRLVRTRLEATRLINKAFRNGFSSYYAFGSLKERWRKFRKGETNLRDLFEGIARFVIPPPYARTRGREKGYIYFQDYIAGNDHDIRVVVIGKRAFAIKRMVRKNDFRASGSGEILYERALFDENLIMVSFDLAEKLRVQCMAFDYIMDKGKALVTEISYGFNPAGYDSCPGFWDNKVTWHEGKFNPYGWMVDDLINRIEEKTMRNSAK